MSDYAAMAVPVVREALTGLSTAEKERELRSKSGKGSDNSGYNPPRSAGTGDRARKDIENTFENCTVAGPVKQIGVGMGAEVSKTIKSYSQGDFKSPYA
jgi:hypothetical protein